MLFIWAFATLRQIFSCKDAEAQKIFFFWVLIGNIRIFPKTQRLLLIYPDVINQHFLRENRIVNSFLPSPVPADSDI